ncbi:TetR/AcrR family transcriptional regulator [Bradyrhizobium sp. CCBAU 21360]|nr:TetR/AcrR family transcriptional regulator [Bradyrhizobium sp. CCBAU 21360]
MNETLRIELPSKATMARSSPKQETGLAGRPRSEASRQAVLEATLELLNSTTVRDLTIEAIAQKAGVGKTTIYRWWSSKSAVVIEAFVDVMLPSTPIPDVDSASEAIGKHISLLIKQYRGKLGRIVAEILAEGQSDPVLLAEFRERFFQNRRMAVRQVVENGIRNGEFDENLDIDTAIDAIYGAVYFRLFLGHLPLDQRFAKDLPRFALSILKTPV